jgi:acyl-CoA dehydrogenase
MAWDFETQPEFQRELDWMDVFVREDLLEQEVGNL